MIPLLALFLAVTPNLDGMVRLIGRDSIAHACPLGAEKAVTNAHVADSSRFIWSVGETHGLFRSVHLSAFRDLAWIVPEDGGTFPSWYTVALKGPEVGEKLWFVGYDFTTQSKAFSPRVFRVTMVRDMGGHIAYKPAGVPGSSGSCVVNARGEVVAVNMGSIALEDKSLIGIGVSVFGSWLRFGEVGN